MYVSCDVSSVITKTHTDFILDIFSLASCAIFFFPRPRRPFFLDSVLTFRKFARLACSSAISVSVMYHRNTFTKIPTPIVTKCSDCTASLSMMLNPWAQSPSYCSMLPSLCVSMFAFNCASVWMSQCFMNICLPNFLTMWFRNRARNDGFATPLRAG